jgi:hypothetical protein
MMRADAAATSASVFAGVETAATWSRIKVNARVSKC